MKSIWIILLILSSKLVQAHQPDLSNLMVYEQNGKYLLVIKSSLTAFEGEIDYHFGKNAYSSPEAFQDLVIKHFQKNCAVVMNNEPIKFINPKVILGHETTLFTELSNPPKHFSAIYIKNTLFKEMPQNMCEVILTLNGFAQKQFLLNQVNNHEVSLKLENGSWVVEDVSEFPYKTLLLLSLGAVFITGLVIAVKAKSKKKILFA